MTTRRDPLQGVNLLGLVGPEGPQISVTEVSMLLLTEKIVSERGVSHGLRLRHCRTHLQPGFHHRHANRARGDGRTFNGVIFSLQYR
jgi:hypothetical protein